MKASLLLAAFALLSLSIGHARIWTSSDGSKTFEGELREYNADTGMVSVLVNGRVMNFPQDKLSEGDVTFLQEKVTKEMEAAANLEGEIAKKVAKAKLQRLEGKRYRRADLEKAPKYYLLYYSASW